MAPTVDAYIQLIPKRFGIYWVQNMHPEFSPSLEFLSFSLAFAGKFIGQLPPTEVVGLSVRPLSFALSTRTSHVLDFLIRDVLRRQSSRESEEPVRCPLALGLADGQPVPSTTSGPVERNSQFDLKSNRAYALPPTAEAGRLPRCYRCDTFLHSKI